MGFDKELQRQEIDRFIKRMPSLSTTVGKVMEICSRTDASPNELNKVISLDPVLTGQVLRLINSAYYSLVNKVTSLTRAITLLGMNTVKNMALSTAIIRTVSSAGNSRALNTSRFWAHSIGAGVSARLLAAGNGVGALEREEFFVGGLLHDLGKIPFGRDYGEVMRLAEQEQAPLIEVEQDLMGIDHQEVGLMIAEKWNLNEVITTSISRHHSVHGLGGVLGEQVAYVALGNAYTNIFDIGYAGNVCTDENELNYLLAVLNISLEDFHAIGRNVKKEIRKAEVFLQIQT